MKEIINNIILLLDKNEDALLIGLLNEKIKTIIEFNNKVTLTYKEIEKAKLGMYTKLSNELQYDLDCNDYYTKLIKLRQTVFNCGNCKYSKVKRHYYKKTYFDYNTKNDLDICKRCNDRDNILMNIENEIADKTKYNILHSINDEKFNELYKCKALLNKINTKLNTLKRKNYATS